MIGWINLSVKASIIDVFGADAWTKVLAESGEEESWVSSCPYSDAVTYNLVLTGARILGVTAGQALEAYGQYFVKYVKAQVGGGAREDGCKLLPGLPLPLLPTCGARARALAAWPPRPQQALRPALAWPRTSAARRPASLPGAHRRWYHPPCRATPSCSSAWAPTWPSSCRTSTTCTCTCR
jgi:hypothetical protein